MNDYVFQENWEGNEIWNYITEYNKHNYRMVLICSLLISILMLTLFVPIIIMTNKEVKLSFSVIRYCYTAKIVYVFELKETRKK